VTAGTAHITNQLKLRKNGQRNVRLTVIGIGYLGLTHAVCMANLGHEVVALDVADGKVAMAAQGELPFFEPGLEPLLRKTLESGRLRFTSSYGEVAQFGEVHFICVGTPEAADGQADLQFVHGAVDSLAPHLTSGCLVVGKSTVPAGTARSIWRRIRMIAPAGEQVDVAWNPEFLREGHAVEDTLRPDRLVFGVTTERAETLLHQVYAEPLAAGVPGLTMNLETAELVKLSANAFLATKISFINAIADACQASGADVIKVADALGYDGRIGRRFLAPGLGFGGGCLPKDIRAFRRSADKLGFSSLARLLATVEAINTDRRAQVVDMTRKALGGTLAGQRVAVLGAAFKPNSDDVRDSPSLDVCERLANQGGVVSVHDPAALQNAARIKPQLRYSPALAEVAAGADIVLHLTEWPQYQAIDPHALARIVARPLLIDARCALDAALWRDAGWTVSVLGRPGQ
jgi:UDPglucose 6-dehydrogenase